MSTKVGIYQQAACGAVTTLVVLCLLQHGQQPLTHVTSYVIFADIKTMEIMSALCPQKNVTAILLSVTSPNDKRFLNFSTSGLSSKFVMKLQLNIPPLLTNVSTLPFETLM